MLVKFSTLANGVFIEDNGTDERKPSDRCFHFRCERQRGIRAVRGPHRQQPCPALVRPPVPRT